MDTYYQVTAASYLSFFRKPKKLIEMVGILHSLTYLLSSSVSLKDYNFRTDFPFSKVSDYFNIINV